jgi:adenylate kinase
MNIILLGPPGAGKGTQSRIIQDKYNLVHISTGDMCRDEVKRASPIGKEIQQIMDSGRFPSDEIILSLFENHLKELKGQGVILDGIPRTLNQAQKIKDIFARLGRTVDGVIQIAVDDEELIQRLSHRYICRTCGASYTEEIHPHVQGECDKCSSHDFFRRPDDEPDAIRTRLEVYNEQTKPLIKFYAEEGKLKVIDGMGSVDAVTVEIESHLSQFQVLTSKSGCLYSAQDI